MSRAMVGAHARGASSRRIRGSSVCDWPGVINCPQFAPMTQTAFDLTSALLSRWDPDGAEFGSIKQRVVCSLLRQAVTLELVQGGGVSWTACGHCPPNSSPRTSRATLQMKACRASLDCGRRSCSCQTLRRPSAFGDQPTHAGSALGRQRRLGFQANEHSSAAPANRCQVHLRAGRSRRLID